MNVGEQTADQPVVESRSRQWMKSKYPDKDFSDDDAYENALADQLETSSKSLEEYQNNDKSISDIIDANPEFALVLQDMSKGVPFRVAVRKRCGDLDLSVDEDEKEYDEWVKAGEEYLKTKKESDERIAKRNANMEESDKRFAAFVEGQKDWNEEKKTGYAQFVLDLCNAMGDGDVSEQVLQMFADAYTHDDDVATALEEGKVEGANNTIEAKRIKQDATDGLPKGGGAIPTTGEQPRRRKVIDTGRILGLSDDELEKRRGKMQEK